MAPDDQPFWKSPTLLWHHGVGEDLAIRCEDTIDEDSEWYRSSPVIELLGAVHGLDAAGARRLAADLNAAADLIVDMPR
ncbi:hypothetical protein AWB93_22790 [Mycobacterium bohemicum]|uniref:Uncharacterized protein n=2 Tax=Mycobacterium bohemicum TaxID=56425 RepID=A0A1X1QWV1_MYCBE|nr:hypothetical protein AWB93_22790 [Mycobacterium bohemicum]